MRDERDGEYVDFVSGRLVAWRRLAFMLCGDEHRADDLVQQAITRLYVQWARARAADNIERYARRVLLNVYLDERRRGWAKVRLVATVPERAERPAGDADDRLVLRAALAKLPPRQRAVLVMRFLADMSVEEVAATLGCSTGTVKSQTSHGLAGLRRLVGSSPALLTRKV